MDIAGNNVNQVFSQGLHHLAHNGVEETSRNGHVLVMPHPVTVTYYMPQERVLFSPLRDANPFFHMFEALWMLAGRNDVAWPATFAKNMLNFSDDDYTLWGAYGYRWRNWFGYDQLPMLVDVLTKNPDSRRCVLAMWDASENGASDSDTYKVLHDGKDVPCNTHAYFDLRGGRLNMTVCNRSNDIVWGLFGANAVHFSFLQQYLAAWLNAPVGLYHQFTNNFHLYPANLPKAVAAQGLPLRESLLWWATEISSNDHYLNGDVRVLELVNKNGGESITDFDVDLSTFFARTRFAARLEPAAATTISTHYHTKFFSTVVQPMFNAWLANKYFNEYAEKTLEEIHSTDWRLACTAWIQRRQVTLAFK